MPWCVSLPTKNGDFPQLCKRLPEANPPCPNLSPVLFQVRTQVQFSHCLRRGMKDMKDSEGSQWITDVDDVHLYIESTSYRCITLPSGNLTQLLKMAHLQWIYPLKMVICHSYVSLPEGIYLSRALSIYWFIFKQTLSPSSICGMPLLRSYQTPP